LLTQIGNSKKRKGEDVLIIWGEPLSEFPKQLNRRVNCAKRSPLKSSGIERERNGKRKERNMGANSPGFSTSCTGPQTGRYKGSTMGSGNPLDGQWNGKRGKVHAKKP